MPEIAFITKPDFKACTILFLFSVGKNGDKNRVINSPIENAQRIRARCRQDYTDQELGQFSVNRQLGGRYL